MKKIFGMLLVIACLGIIKVNAADYYFTKSPGEDGYTYTLCEGNNCIIYTESALRDAGAYISDSEIHFGPGSHVYYYRAGQVTPQPNGPSSDTETSNQGGTSNATTREVKAPVTDTCERLREPLVFIGHIVTIFKIIIPILLVAFGIMDFFRAVTAGKDDEIKKSTKTFARRVLAGVVIFFLPTIVSLIFSLIDSWGEFEGDFNACQKCVFRVSQCK